MTFTVTSLNYANAKQMLREGLDAIEAGARTVRLDMGDAGDSATVSVIIEWQKAAEAKGSTLTFTGASEAVKSLVSVYGVDSLLTLA